MRQVKRTDPLVRFFRHVQPCPITGCWEWQGTLGRDGYGKFKIGGRQGTMVRVHRWAYETFVGSIPDDRELHHRCENRRCVNPEHLQALTRGEHARRSRSASITHCKHGHEYSPENTYYRPTPSGLHRDCRACGRLRQLAYRDRKQGAA